MTRGTGLGSWVLGPPEAGLWSLKLVKTRKKSSWNEGKLRFSFIFAQKDTGRTPSHLWYFGQRCWLLDDLTDFFGYNTKLPLHMGRAERAAIFFDRYGLGLGSWASGGRWVLGLGPPGDAGSWVLGSGPKTRAAGQLALAGHPRRSRSFAHLSPSRHLAPSPLDPSRLAPSPFAWAACMCE